MKSITLRLQLWTSAAKEQMFKGLWVRLTEWAQGSTLPETTAGGFAGWEDISTDFEVKRSKRRGKGGEIEFASRLAFEREVEGQSRLGRARGKPSRYFLFKEESFKS